VKGDDIMAGTIDTTSKVSNQIMSSTSKTSNTKKSNTLNMENFLSLLVAEMQNQDPLEPTSNSDYMAQMATFSQVEATSEMNERVLSQTASNLIGKAVIVKTDTNSTGYAGGIVNGWQEIDGIVYLGINGNLYDINDVDQVIDKDYYEKWNNNGSNGSTAGSSKTDTDNKTE
jgi:flagellar hook assembly protein FlgD